MVISEDPWNTCTPFTDRLAVELSLPVLKLSRSVATGNRTKISSMRDERSTHWATACGEYNTTPQVTTLHTNKESNWIQQHTTSYHMLHTNKESNWIQQHTTSYHMLVHTSKESNWKQQHTTSYHMLHTSIESYWIQQHTTCYHMLHTSKESNWIQ